MDSNFNTYIQNELDQNGFCVIENILSNDKSDKYINDIWNWLSNLNPNINRNDPSTFNDFNWPFNIHGIIQHYNIAHQQFVWDIRCEDKVVEVFKNIWNDDNLIVSFDCSCIMKPYIYNSEEYEKKENKKWFHTDQSSLKIGRHCIQGFVNLEDAYDNDGCLYVIEKSHLYHERLFKEYKNLECRSDWYEIKKDEYEWLLSFGLKEKKVNAPKGSLVLFDSRLFHCNSPPNKLQEIPRWRYAIYVCMTPKKLLDEKNKKQRDKAFRNKRTTSHWPHLIRVFPKNHPEIYNDLKYNFNIINNDLNINNKDLL